MPKRFAGSAPWLRALGAGALSAPAEVVEVREPTEPLAAADAAPMTDAAGKTIAGVFDKAKALRLI